MDKNNKKTTSREIFNNYVEVLNNSLSNFYSEIDKILMKVNTNDLLSLDEEVTKKIIIAIAVNKGGYLENKNYCISKIQDAVKKVTGYNISYVCIKDILEDTSQYIKENKSEPSDNSNYFLECKKSNQVLTNKILQSNSIPILSNKEINEIKLIKGSSELTSYVLKNKTNVRSLIKTFFRNYDESLSLDDIPDFFIFDSVETSKFLGMTYTTFCNNLSRSKWNLEKFYLGSVLYTTAWDLKNTISSQEFKKYKKKIDKRRLRVF